MLARRSVSRSAGIMTRRHRIRSQHHTRRLHAFQPSLQRLTPVRFSTPKRYSPSAMLGRYHGRSARSIASSPGSCFRPCENRIRVQQHHRPSAPPAKTPPRSARESVSIHRAAHPAAAPAIPVPWTDEALPTGAAASTPAAGAAASPPLFRFQEACSSPEDAKARRSWQRGFPGTADSGPAQGFATKGTKCKIGSHPSSPNATVSSLLPGA